MSGSLAPYKQGALDYLCGLYSIVNGMRFAAARDRPLSKRESRWLFREGMKWLVEVECAYIVRVGLEPEYWHDLAWHLFGVAAEKGLVDLKRGKRALRILSFETEEAIHEVERAVASGIAVAVELQRALNHYTVVSGIEDDRWILFDSNNNTSIKKTSLGAKGVGKRHNLGDRAIFFQPR